MAAKVLGLASYFADRRQPEIIHAKLRSEVRLEAISDLEFSVGIGDGGKSQQRKAGRNAGSLRRTSREVTI